MRTESSSGATNGLPDLPQGAPTLPHGADLAYTRLRELKGRGHGTSSEICRRILTNQALIHAAALISGDHVTTLMQSRKRGNDQLRRQYWRMCFANCRIHALIEAGKIRGCCRYFDPIKSTEQRNVPPWRKGLTKGPLDFNGVS